MYERVRTVIGWLGRGRWCVLYCG